MVRSSVVSLVAVALCAYALTADPAGEKNVGNGQGGQFITGRCLNNADCASNCCAQVGGGPGVCSGPQAAFQQGKTGCGFVDPAGNGQTGNRQAGNGQAGNGQAGNGCQAQQPTTPCMNNNRNRLQKCNQTGNPNINQGPAKQRQNGNQAQNSQPCAAQQLQTVNQTATVQAAAQQTQNGNQPPQQCAGQQTQTVDCAMNQVVTKQAQGTNQAQNGDGCQ